MDLHLMMLRRVAALRCRPSWAVPNGLRSLASLAPRPSKINTVCYAALQLGMIQHLQGGDLPSWHRFQARMANAWQRGLVVRTKNTWPVSECGAAATVAIADWGGSHALKEGNPGSVLLRLLIFGLAST